MSTELQMYNPDGSMTLEGMKAQVQTIQQIMNGVMKKGEHYGVIPGCGDKPTLLKPGAEKIALTFRLSPSYKIETVSGPGEHREYRIICTLTHIPSGQIFGEGVGSCSTMERKYRYRNASKTCPECGKETIIKGKAEYGGGWLCYAKKGGCGAKFDNEDPAITQQPVGKVEHDNPADFFNTVLKMAKKRAQVDATLTATAASDCFTQDIEDMPEVIKNTEEATKSEPKAGGEDDVPIGETGTDGGPIDGTQVKRLQATRNENDWPESAYKSLIAEYGFTSTKEITRGKFPEIMKMVKIPFSEIDK